MIVALYGADHTELDAATVADLDAATTVALTRGRFPKGYASVDPNEDAVLGAAGPAGRVLAVADGHNGVEASHAALRALAAHAEGLVTGPGHGGEVVARLFEEAISATAAALDGVAPPRDRSRTALTVACVRPGEVHAGTLGDTVAAVVRGTRVRRVGRAGPFLGPHSPLPAIARARLREGDVVVVFSDGLGDFLAGGWEPALAQAVASTSAAGATATHLVERAMSGGAGDNVAVAVTDAAARNRRWRPRRWGG